MNKIYNVTEFAELIGKSVKTLQRWDRDGILTAYRSPTNRRYYTHQQLMNYLGQTTKECKQKVIYARVSTRNQKDDLDNQLKYIMQYCNENHIDIGNVYTDIGSGMNYKRKQWNKLIEDAMNGNISEIFVAYKDRFVRFGFDWICQLLEKYGGCKVTVLNDTILTPEEEVIEDLITIIHVFSCRCYGLRKYSDKLTKVVKKVEKGD